MDRFGADGLGDGSNNRIVTASAIGADFFGHQNGKYSRNSAGARKAAATSHGAAAYNSPGEARRLIICGSKPAAR